VTHAAAKVASEAWLWRLVELAVVIDTLFCGDAVRLMAAVLTASAHKKTRLAPIAYALALAESCHKNFCGQRQVNLFTRLPSDISNFSRCLQSRSNSLQGRHPYSLPRGPACRHFRRRDSTQSSHEPLPHPSLIAADYACGVGSTCAAIECCA